MNVMQQYPVKEHGYIFATAYPPRPIEPTKIFGTYTFEMPVLNPHLAKVQHNLEASRATREGISIIGAWTRGWSHEDGWVSGLSAVMDEPLRVKLPFEIVPGQRAVQVGHLDRVVRLGLVMMDQIRREIEQVWIWLMGVLAVLWQWIQTGLPIDWKVEERVEDRKMVS